MIVLPGPILLADPLPAGWRRPDPAPWRDPAEVAITVERLAPGRIAPVIDARPAPVTRAERIEAAARALLAAADNVASLDGCGSNTVAAAAWRREALAVRALRAALCTCTAHGPDPACVDHGAAIARWQKENGT